MTTGKNVSFLHCLSQYHAELQNVVMQSCLQMNGGKLVMWPETEAGSELSLISFDVTHPDLAPVKVDMFTDFTP